MKDKKYAFLAIFGDRDWPPVCFGKVNGKRGLYADFGMIFCVSLAAIMAVEKQFL